jgi:hypothetical protein
MDNFDPNREFDNSTQNEAQLRAALDLARTSQDGKERALVPTILSKMAWYLHNQGLFDQALPRFEEALLEWSRQGTPGQIQTARWAVARCLRSLGRSTDALEILLDLEAEQSMTGVVAEDVLTEISENKTFAIEN